MRLNKFKDVIKNYLNCKKKLKECEEINKFLNEQIKSYNNNFTKNV